jgi:hypothetical protein
MLLVGDLDRTCVLANAVALWTLILTIDFLISFSHTLRPRLPEQP